MAAFTILSNDDFQGDKERRNRKPRGWVPPPKVQPISRETMQRMGQSGLVADSHGEPRVPGDSDPPADSEDESKIE